MAGAVPLLVTGSSRQSLEWIGQHADGWLTYPGVTATRPGRRTLGEKIAAYRQLVPDAQFRPHATNEWIDLDET